MSIPQRIELQTESFEWSQVDFQLQIATGKSSLKLLTVHKYIDTSSQYLDYKMTHNSMINITDFSKQYSDKIISKSLGLEDVVFKCGHINIQKYLGNQHKILTFLICKVHLGKIGLSSDKDVSSCDSIFIKPDNQDEDIFQFNYFLRTPNQYSIQYEVTFAPSDEKQFKISDYQCSNCENRVPTIYCRQENLIFCDQCSLDHHRSKLMSTHKLQTVDKVNTLQSCKTHTSSKLQYYCSKCTKYLCLQCIQKGLHYQNHEHPVQQISLLYEQKHQNIEIVCKKPYNKLETLNMNLGVKRKQIEQNYLTIKQAITKKYQIAMQVLDDIYYQKCQLLNSCQIEIKMLNQKIQWSRAFIKFEEKNLKPVYYFESEKKFDQEINKLKVPEFQSILVAKPDIKLEGELVVGTRDNIDFYRKKMEKETKLQKVQLNDSQGTDGINIELYKYKGGKEKHKMGDLSSILEGSKLNFFQIISS